MSYTRIYKGGQEETSLADQIRANAQRGRLMGAEERRGVFVRPPRKKKKTEEETGGSFFGGFSSALSGGLMSKGDPAQSDYDTWLNNLVNSLQAQVNTPENREALGTRRPEEIEADRQVRMRQDFSQHIANGGTVKEFDYLKYQYGDDTIRNKPISDKLIKDMSFLKDMGIQMVVYSGGQTEDRRTGGPRHNDGNAADAYFIDIKSGRILDWSKPSDQPIFKEIFYRGYMNGVQGWGAHQDYMGTKNVHLGYGTPAVWGKGGTGMPAPWLWEAWQNARAGKIPEQFKAAATRTASLMDRDTGSPKGLVQNESSGRWDATNQAGGSGGKGHFGRVQWSRGRYSEAQAAGVVPKNMPIEEFATEKNKELQMAAEEWHFQDIRNFIKRNGLDRYIGQTINGVRVTMDGLIAVAHLGGKTGLKQHLTSGGTYNPSDTYIDPRTGKRVKGNTLTDYMRKHMA